MQNLKRNVMHGIKMKRVELLGIVSANLQTHISEFNESVEDYKKLVLQITTVNLKLAKSASLDEFKKIKALPSLPVSYEDSYKRAIRMLELSVEDIIDIEEDVFNQLVLDEWQWKRAFTVSNATYKVGSSY